MSSVGPAIVLICCRSSWFAKAHRTSITDMFCETAFHNENLPTTNVAEVTATWSSVAINVKNSHSASSSISNPATSTLPATEVAILPNWCQKFFFGVFCSSFIG